MPRKSPDDKPAATRLSGKLELTWTNKNKALLSHEDESYEWVPRRDRRVAEVRLLRNAGTVGDVHADADRVEDDLLIRGDALHALTALTELPEFAERYLGKVKLVYIDPPFNTGQAFEHYNDGIEHSVWLTMMRDRLSQVKRLLSPDGSLWVHLDDIEMAHCRVLLDEIFGRESFIASIVWEKAQGARNDTHLSGAHDYIHVYAPAGKKWRLIRNLLTRSDRQRARYQNPDNDPRGPWRQGDNGTAKSGSEDARFLVTLPSGRQVRPPEGTYWRFSQMNLTTARAEGRVWFGRDGDSLPIIKRYLSDVQAGVVPRTWWPALEVGSNQEAKRDHLRRMFPDREPFATPKPERLMERIVHIGSNPGDIVLDCFAGSGTTAAVAHKMGRRWVTVERRRDTVDTFTAPRLKKVVEGSDPGGITEAQGWEGGGGFRVLDVAPSMYAEDQGVVVLADWATNSELGELVAAQLGFAYEASPPFCGRHNRMRLAVIDGHANAPVVRALVQALPGTERLTLCATSLDAEAPGLLAKLRSGSRARVIPEDILISYATPSSWRVSVATADSAGSDTDADAGVEGNAEGSPSGDPAVDDTSHPVGGEQEEGGSVASDEGAAGVRQAGATAAGDMS